MLILNWKHQSKHQSAPHSWFFKLPLPGQLVYIDKHITRLPVHNNKPVYQNDNYQADTSHNQSS